MIGTTAGLAFSALLRNKLRSMLTMLGIVIGVAAVVMMQSVGRGATAYVGEAISGLGSNMLIVMPGQAKGMQQNTLGAPLFTAGDLDAVRHQARDVGLVTAAGSRVLRVVFGSNNRSVNSGGVMPEYFEIRGWGVSSGRLPTQEDERGGAAVCVVGQTVSDALFERRDPVGKDLRVHDMTCRVIGVLEPKGASAFGIDQDDVVFLPYTTFARRILGNDRIGILMATAPGCGAPTSGRSADHPKRKAARGFRRAALRRERRSHGCAQDLTVKILTDHKRSDSEIAAAVQSALKWDVWVPPTVTATVQSGSVTLAGQVPWNYQRDAAERAVRHLTGVVTVHDSITLAPQASAAQVKEKVQAALLRQAKADAKSIHVDTSGGKVTLTGNASSWQSIEDAANAAWAAPGVTEVIDHVKMAMTTV